MSNDLHINPDQLRNAAARLSAGSEDFTSQSAAMLSELSDPSFLGTNDTLGSIASMLYSLAIQAFQESINSIIEELGIQASLLSTAAYEYQAGDANAEIIANQVGM